MNKTDEYINQICSYIKNKAVHKNISEELRNHIDELKYELSIEENIDESQSEEIALNRMGEVSKIGKEFNRIYSNSFDILLILGTTSLIILYIFTMINLQKDGIISSNTSPIVSLVVGIILFLIIFFSDYQKIIRNRHYLLLVIGLLNLTIIPIWDLPKDMSRFSLLLFVLGFSSILSNYKCKSIEKNMFFLISNISLFLISKSYSVILLCTLSIMIIFNVLNNKKRISNLVKILFFIFVSIIMLLILTFVTQSYLLEDFINAYNIDENISMESWDIYLKREIIQNSSYFNDYSLATNVSLGGLEDNNVLVYLLNKYGKFIIITIITISYIMCCKQVFNISKMKDTLGKNILLGISSMFILEFIINLLNIIGCVPDIYISMPFISVSNINIIESLVMISVILAVYKKKNYSLITDNM